VSGADQEWGLPARELARRPWRGRRTTANARMAGSHPPGPTAPARLNHGQLLDGRQGGAPTAPRQRRVGEQAGPSTGSPTTARARATPSARMAGSRQANDSRHPEHRPLLDDGQANQAAGSSRPIHPRPTTADHRPLLDGRPSRPRPPGPSTGSSSTTARAPATPSRQNGRLAPRQGRPRQGAEHAEHRQLLDGPSGRPRPDRAWPPSTPTPGCQPRPRPESQARARPKYVWEAPGHVGQDVILFHCPIPCSALPPSSFWPLHPLR
jgi:hypothetical protein